MYKNAYANSFRDLSVYQKAVAVETAVFDMTKSLPAAERFALTDQVRRSSRSIGAEIAEAWGKRRYRAHFISKLTDADAEQLETQHWLEVAERAGLVARAQITPLLSELVDIGRMLNGMIHKAASFCQEDRRDTLREDGSDTLSPLESRYRSQVTGHAS